MKLSGLHLHMILVIVIICILLYIFYVSKDIITLDNQVRQLRVKLDVLERQQVATPAQVKSIETQVDPEDFHHEEPEVHDDTASVDSEKITEMLTAIAETNSNEHVAETGQIDEESQEEETEAVEKTDDNTTEERSMSLQELRELCKKHGLFAQGGKKKLIELLKAHEILV